MEEQSKQAKEISMLKADKALQTINQVAGDFVMCGTHQEIGKGPYGYSRFLWDPAHLSSVKLPDASWDDEEVIAAVAVAYPMYVEDVRSLLETYRKLLIIRDDALSSPFPAITPDWDDWPDLATRDRKNDFDAVLNMLFVRSNRTSPLLFKNRAQRDPAECFRLPA